MRPLKYIPSYEVNDYNLWEGNWELIDGLPYAMSPSPTKKHQFLATDLIKQIGSSFEKQKSVCGDCREVHELDWVIDKTTVVRPDIAVICDKTGDYITSAPVLIIEIISPSTGLKDRQVKFELYQELGVKYYIIADPETKKYNIFELLNGKYQERNNLNAFLIHENCGLQLDFAAALANFE